MHVWVQPLEWDGEEEERPIEQIRVEATSYSGTDPVKGLQAAVAVDSECKPLFHPFARAPFLRTLLQGPCDTRSHAWTFFPKLSARIWQWREPVKTLPTSFLQT